ncbi:undecaprenyl-phosphate glucose phosphotransferase [Bacteroides sp.]|mgnify:CR=1 FL=1|uniref:undecaprenyl-phosphate glucose phosphotransferase n=1 Tax=Bacteroides sp. TaxID=29523 RepID=UPI002582CC93|nr:undecaprenyl-phosphate glucose phosphotransferase [Bacteroides sp.]
MASTNQINKVVELIVVLGDLVILNFCLFQFLFFWEKASIDLPFSGTASLMMTYLSLCYLACSASRGKAWNSREIRPDQLVLRVLKNIVTFSIFGACIMAFSGISIIYPLFFVIYFFILFVVLSIYRIIIRHFLIGYCAKGNHKRYAVFIGGGNNMQMLYEEMESSLASIYEVVGYFDVAPNDALSSQCSYLGNPDGFADFMSEKTDIKHIFCSLAMEQGRYNVSITNYCENHLLYFHGVPNVSKGFPRRIWHSMVGNMPILNLRYEPLSKMENRLLKRIFDIVLSGLFLVTIFPFIYLIVGSIIKLTSPGPILFKQMRTGLNGREFKCYKFRSMKVNDEADSKQATADDPRKTRFGNFLRRSNIDELPQFINVFKGDMAIVGPRPHMLAHTETYARLIDKYMVRHFIKPGVTGWAQTHGFRGETRELSQMEGRVKADIWYMEHWTLVLDIYIIYKTVANVVIGEKNAY